ncbi:MAG TPA: mechanosensitive ion channel domain-containing protein, partial [bacterium]|nr:mechanosensitive ion channel domain-containing protein [bacterium]
IYFILVFGGLLSVLGYVKLSGFILSRVFYTIAVILLGILINRILYDALNWIVPEKKRKSTDEEDQSAQFWERVYTIAQFTSSVVLIIIGTFFIAKIWWLLGDQSIGESILSVFTFRLFYVQDTPITIWSLIKAILIFALFLYISRLVRNFLKSSVLQKTKLDVGARHAVLTITHYIILVVGLVVAVESVGIQLTTLKIFAGALGLGIGFGLQNIANNFASGLIILFERPIKSKDFVQVGEILGTVTRISARSTTILTRDNIAIIVPNSDFIEKTVVNWSLNNTPTRVHVPIGVEYGTNPERVRDALLDIADAHPRVLAIPRPRIWFKEFGESSMDFELMIWINDPQEGVNNIKSDINFQIHQAFQEKGIRIPFPQRDVHLKIDTRADIEVLRSVFSDQPSQPKTTSAGSQESQDDHPGQNE